MAVRMCLLLLALPAMLAQGAEAPARFRFCSMDVDYPPFANQAGTGHLQYLTAQAARGMGMEFERSFAPRRRCIEQLKAGLVDGMIGAYSAERAEFAMYPMAGAEPDERKVLAVPRYYVYRRKGSVLNWDGRRFSGLADGRIGVQSGFAVIIEQLQQLQVAYDDGAKALEPNFGKLASGRLAGVIAMDAEADRLLASRYPGKIERTARPFEQTPLYLMISPQFHARYPAAAARYWQALQDYRASSDYRRYQQSHR